jgi:hypothetical protein
MAINGFKHIETFIIAVALFGAIVCLCYFQDQYLNTMYNFNPSFSPHFFAIPLYIILIIFVMFKSLENIYSILSSRVAIITTICLLFSSTFLIIQKLHIFYNTRRNKVDTDDVEEQDEDKLDKFLSNQRADIKFEVFYYVNISVFQLVLSWVVINLTRNQLRLNGTYIYS